MPDPDLDGPYSTVQGLGPDTEPERDVLLELLVRWEEARARGEDATPETLCLNDPRWLEELRARIAKRKRLHAVMGLSAAMDGGRVEGASPEPLPEFPGHTILDAIGRGGMGMVFRALDVRLGRIVAIKTIAEAKYASRSQVERFLVNGPESLRG